SFFFSGSETALTAANRMKIQTEAENGDKKSAKLSKLLTKPSEFITTILIGNNIANIILPTLVIALALSIVVHVGISISVTTVAIIIISEVIPKSVATTYLDRMSRLFYTTFSFFVTIFKPFTKLLIWLTDMINNLFS